MPLENFFHSVTQCNAFAPLFAMTDAEVDFQFQIWIGRMILFLICPGLVYLLGNSNLLSERKRNGAVIAGILRGLFSLGADIALVHAGAYKYNVDNLLYQGVPIDAHIIYGCVLGTGLCLAWEESAPLFKPVVLALSVALAIMFNRWCAGSGHILTPMSTNYQTYDMVVQCALPVITVFFYILVDERRALIFRSVIYAICYFAVTYFLIPSIVLSMSFGEVHFPTAKWQAALVAVAALSVPGAWAAGQFAVSGKGTPLELDPTTRLIVTGPYAYVRNPMQISCLGVAVVWATTTNSPALWIYVGVLLIVMQVARYYEEDDLHRRFGERYKLYCKGVWRWIPRLWSYEEFF